MWWVVSAWAADVWVTIDAADEQGALTLTLPAEQLARMRERPIRTWSAGPVDLAGLAREVKQGEPGVVRRVHVSAAREQVATVVLAQREAAGEPATSLVFTVREGNEALEMSMPLSYASLRRAAGTVDLPVDLEALAVGLDRRDLQIVRSYPGTVLLDLQAPGAMSVRIETR